jgi:DNA-binding NarL/FixJ family response regulator
VNVQKKINVSIVGNSSKIEYLVKRALTFSEQLQLVSVFENLDDLLIKFDHKEEIDVLLFISHQDNLNDFNEFEKLKGISPNLKIFVISLKYNFHEEYFALLAGANGYFVESDDLQELTFYIQSIYKGKIIFSENLTNALLLHSKPITDIHLLKELSTRELQILKLLAKGFQNKKIADALFICEDTLETHLRHIYTKLHIKNKSEAIVKTLTNGWA